MDYAGDACVSGCLSSQSQNACLGASPWSASPACL